MLELLASLAAEFCVERLNHQRKNSVLAENCNKLLLFAPLNGQFDSLWLLKFLVAAIEG